MAEKSTKQIDLDQLCDYIKCEICFNFLLEPHFLYCRCSKCICKNCVEMVLADKKQCPFCRHPLTTDKIVRVRIFDDLLTQLSKRIEDSSSNCSSSVSSYVSSSQRSAIPCSSCGIRPDNNSELNFIDFTSQVDEQFYATLFPKVNDSTCLRKLSFLYQESLKTTLPSSNVIKEERIFNNMNKRYYCNSCLAHHIKVAKESSEHNLGELQENICSLKDSARQTNLIIEKRKQGINSAKKQIESMVNRAEKQLLAYKAITMQALDNFEENLDQPTKSQLDYIKELLNFNEIVADRLSKRPVNTVSVSNSSKKNEDLQLMKQYKVMNDLSESLQFRFNQLICQLKLNKETDPRVFVEKHKFNMMEIALASNTGSNSLAFEPAISSSLSASCSTAGVSNASSSVRTQNLNPDVLPRPAFEPYNGRHVTPRSRAPPADNDNADAEDGCRQQ